MLKGSLAIFLISASATFSFAQTHEIHQPKLTPQKSGTTQLLISVSPVKSRVVWEAATGGTYVVTNDGGETWKAAVELGTETQLCGEVQTVTTKVAHQM